MEFVVFGVNHTTAPVDIRERWAFSESESLSHLSSIRSRIHPSEHLILSTCNRTEYYCRLPFRKSPLSSLSDPDEQRKALADFFLPSRRNLEPGDLQHAYLYRERAAVEHLFRLAGGLDSMIVGESEILGQIKSAYHLSQEAQTLGSLFHRLFPAALNTGKRVRTETNISHGCITPGQAALKLTGDVLGDVQDQPTLLIGSGEIGAVAARAFFDAGVASFEICNRTQANAEKLIAKIQPSQEEKQPEIADAGKVGSPDIRARNWSELHEAIETANIVVSSTGASLPIVTQEDLAEIQTRRGERPLLIVDLAIPRDFSPDCAKIPGVRLFNIDDLNQIIKKNVEERHSHIPRAEEIVQRQVHAFCGRLNYELQIDPVIRHMFERFEGIRLGVLQQALDGFPPEQHQLLDDLTRSLVNKLINFPISRLKSLRDLGDLSAEEAKFFRKLFPTDPQ